MKHNVKKFIFSLLSFGLLIVPSAFANNDNLNIAKAESLTSIRDKEVRLDILPFSYELSDPSKNVFTKEYALDVLNTKCTVTLENVKYIAPDINNKASYELSSYFASSNKVQIKINLDKQFYIKEATIQQLGNTSSLTAGVKDSSINRTSSKKFQGNTSIDYASNSYFYDEIRLYTYDKTNLPRVSLISLLIKAKPIDIKLSTTSFAMNKKLNLKLDVNHLPNLLENEVLTYKLEVFNTKNELLTSGSNITKINAKQFSFDIVFTHDLCVCNFVFTISSSIPDSLSNYKASFLTGINISPIAVIREWGDTVLKMKDYDSKINVGVDGPNECITRGYYANAKTKLFELEKKHDGIIYYLQLNPEYNKIVMQRKERYEAWARANQDIAPYQGEEIVRSNSIIINFDDNSMIIALSIIGGTATILSFAYFINKLRNSLQR